MKRLVPFLVFTVSLLCVASTSLASVADYEKYAALVPDKQVYANGHFHIQVKDSDAWRTVDRLAFDTFFRDASCDLSAHIGHSTRPVAVRLVHVGGEAAHIDAVSLGKLLPASGDPRVARKIAAKDFDVLDVTGETLDFKFANTGDDLTLHIVARIEGSRISKEPFKFPLINTFRKLGPDSLYYTYTARGESLGAPGKAMPMFQELCVPGTGHPVGYTYGWAWNDDDYLYVYMDVTGDNTFDGTKDYAAVHVNVGGEVKTFRVSLNEGKYGKTRFEYTDRADYQHKTYRFKIPRSEVSGLDAPLQMAFSVYGTMAPIYDWECKIPYSLVDGDWWTGLHIRPDPTYFGGGLVPVAPAPTTYAFTIYFFGNSDVPYATVNRNIPDGGWTGFVQNLLDTPANFQSPSYLLVTSDQRFTVTQFLGQFSQPGFSHQTFFAFPYGMGWPFEEESVILK